MAGFNTQFHATLDELGDLIEAWMDEYPIVVSAFAFPPESRVPISRKTIRAVLSQNDVLSMSFTTATVSPEMTSAYEVARAGLGPMLLNIGRINHARGLEQSDLSTLDPNPLWKKLNNQLKRKFPAGADFFNEETGQTTYERNFRFSPGAKALAASGVPLRQFHQSTHVFMPK